MESNRHCSNWWALKNQPGLMWAWNVCQKHRRNTNTTSGSPAFISPNDSSILTMMWFLYTSLSAGRDVAGRQGKHFKQGRKGRGT